MKINKKNMLIFLFLILITNSFAENVAIICGIADYFPLMKSPTENDFGVDIPGADNGAREIYNTLLKDNKNWKKENIQLLLNEDVTHHNIEKVIQNLVVQSNIKADDQFLFYFAGRTGQLKIQKSEEDFMDIDEDGIDEFLQLFYFSSSPRTIGEYIPNPYIEDSTELNYPVFNFNPKTRDIFLDHDLEKIINERNLGTKNIIMIIDSCLSQGMSIIRKELSTEDNKSSINLQGMFNYGFFDEFGQKYCTLCDEGVYIGSCALSEDSYYLANPGIRMPALSYLLCDVIKKDFLRIDGYKTRDKLFFGKANGKLSIEECIHFLNDEWNMYNKYTQAGKENHRYHNILKKIDKSQNIYISDHDPYISESELFDVEQLKLNNKKPKTIKEN